MAKQISNYSNPALLIDRSAELLSKELSGAATKATTQLENIRISKNKAAEEEAKFDKLINEVSGGEGLGFKDELQNLFSIATDENYSLAINSIGRDQTEYLRNTSQLQSAINQVPQFLALLDEEAKMYGDAMLSDPSRKVLNSTDPLAREFMDDIRTNNGNNIKPTYENGNVILTYTNKEGKKYVLNSANYQKARENGAGDIIRYTKDHNPEYKAIFDQLATKDNYEALTQQFSSLTGEGEDRQKLVTLKEKWDEANDELRNDLMNNTTLAAMIDESAFQALNPGEVWTASKDQIQKTREQVVDYIMDQYANESKTLKYIKSAFPEEKIKFSEKDYLEREKYEGTKAAVEYFFNRDIKHAYDILALEQDSKERAKLTRDLLNEYVPGGGFYFEEQEEGRFRVFDPSGVEVGSMETRNGIINTLSEYGSLLYGDQKQKSEKRDMINALLLQDERRRGIGKNNKNTEIDGAFGATGATGVTSNITGGNVR